MTNWGEVDVLQPVQTTECRQAITFLTASHIEPASQRFEKSHSLIRIEHIVEPGVHLSNDRVGVNAHFIAAPEEREFVFHGNFIC
ncbi:MAG: hypothetical protein ABL973_08705 [Micropepsaceae bacterium]